MASLPCYVRVVATPPPAGAPPVAAFVAVPPSGSSSTWQLLDTSAGGSATSWQWDSPDLGSLGTDPIGGLPDPGSHQEIVVKLTVANAAGSDQVQQLIVTGMPIADFATSPSSGAAPLAVQFTDTSRNAPTGWKWDFGDGQTSTERNPVHTYVSPGVYPVTLVAKNEWGSGTPYSQQVVAYTRPQASFTAQPTSGVKPLRVQFTDTSSNMPTSWYWVFGDSNLTVSTEQNPTFTYYTQGTYTVFLTATNPAGYSTVTMQVTVSRT
jgi:PKD repeat protein